MRVHPRTIKSTKQVSFWLGKLNFWTNIVANPKTKCLSAILGHVESANCSIISSRLSLLRRIKPYFNCDSSLHFYNSCVNNYFTYCSAAWGNCSTIFCYVPVRVLLPLTSLRRVRKLLRHFGGKTGQVIWELNFARESRNCVVVHSRGADRVCRLSIDNRNFTQIDGDRLFTCRTEYVYRILKYEHVKKYTFKGVKN